MKYVYTLFEPGRDSWPLVSGVYDPSSKSVRVFPLYLSNTGESLYHIEQNIKKRRGLLIGHEVMINEFKQHLIAFGLNPSQDSPRPPDIEAYDVDLPEIPLKNIRAIAGSKESLEMAKKILVFMFKRMKKIQLREWQKIRARSAVVYSFLQRRGMMYGYEHMFPIWGRTFSGRSKTSGFNAHGHGEGYLANTNGDKVLLNFDWVAADMRAVAIMSGDQKLTNSFSNGDPYKCLMGELSRNGQLHTRDDSKRLMFKCIYSLGGVNNNPALKYYAEFGRWITQCRKRLKENKYLESILGRRFYINKDRDEKSVFNATIQGSVAHAMQICLRKAWELYPHSVLTENHDSLVITSDKKDIKKKIKDIAKIMVQPFLGISSLSNPQFPLRVSIGKEYKKWKKFKRYDSVDQIK